MPFPETGVLDSFSRANENPLGGGLWTTNVNAMQLLSNQAASAVGIGTYAESYYSLAALGPDLESYVTVATKAPNSYWIYINCRTNISPFNCYGIWINSLAGTDSWELYRIDNGSFTLLTPAVTQEYSSGDSIGISVIGSTLTAYLKVGAGEWAPVMTRTDSTYKDAGYLTFGTNHTTTRFDDFGGGTTYGPNPYYQDFPKFLLRPNILKVGQGRVI